MARAGSDKREDLTPDERIVVGEIVAASGLKGEVRIRSHTRPADEILSFEEWLVGGTTSAQSPGRSGWARPEWSEEPGIRRYRLRSGGRRGRHLIARLQGVDDRERAEALVGQTIRVARDSLPAAAEGEYYWDDLVGLEVVSMNGKPFGLVDHLVETGANDVLVVRGAGDTGEVLIPWIPQVITAVDLEARRITVDWDADY